MKKVKDERLLIKNLKNIRIAFLVQIIGLFAALTYEVITEGPREAIGHPIFLSFLLTMIVYFSLTISISKDMYEDNDGKKS